MTVLVEDFKPWEQIQAAGKYYVIVHDKAAERTFNNLPPEEVEEGKSQIIIPEHLIDKQQQDGVNKGMEYVFRIHSVGPDADLVVTEQGGLKKVEPMCKVGDIVLCKGTCPEILTNPRFRIATRDNIVAIFKNTSSIIL